MASRKVAPDEAFSKATGLLHIADMPASRRSHVYQ
jgi:hypothetical protein